MRYLLFMLILSCNTYTGVVISTDEFNQTARVKINDQHYMIVGCDTDSTLVGDTIEISKDFKIIE